MQKETTPELPVNEKCANAILALLPTMQGEKHAPDIKRLCEVYFLEHEARTKLAQLRGIDDFINRAITEPAFILHYVGSQLNMKPEEMTPVFVRHGIAVLPLSIDGAVLAEIVTRFFEMKNDAKELIEAAPVDSRPSDSTLTSNS